MNREKCDNISDRQLQLAGFTLAALAFVVGFYKNAFTEAAILIFSLLVSMFVFFLGSYVAHEAETLGQAFASDVFQYVGVITLVASFTIFLVGKLNNQIIEAIPILLTALLSFYLLRGLWRMHKFYKQFTTQKENERELDY